MDRRKFMKTYLRKIVKKIIVKLIPELNDVFNESNNFNSIRKNVINSNISEKSRIYGNCSIVDVELGDYSYIGRNATISLTKIGKFCSIGPNIVCGYGIHPTNGLSTAPMFYANNISNGITLCKESKIQERKLITIKNDVWIGSNVTILDGVTIGNGAIVAAGAVVTKNIPDYAIYGGVPAKLIRYRFSNEQIIALLKIKWWNFDFKTLSEVEKNFFDIDGFIKKYK
jgi:acetyltransferase-like isoleucine patch superfamily enzyme